jgi:hypothetical protein
VLFALAATLAFATPTEVKANLLTESYDPGIEGHAENPLFSPDGEHISYEVNQLKDNRRLVIGSLKKGSMHKHVTPVLSAASAFGGADQVHADSAWHPTGQLIFSGSISKGDYRLYLVPAKGGTPVSLVDLKTAPGNLTFPTMTADGQTMYFVSSDTGKGDIYRYDDGIVKPLVESPQTETYPSPRLLGGLVYTRRDGNSNNVYEQSRGGEVKPVALGDQHYSRGVTAGSDVLLFEDDETASMIAYGFSGKRVIAEHIRLPTRSRPPVSFDGAWTAWTMDQAGARYVMLARIDGSKQIKLLVEQSALGDPVFGRHGDRTLLAFTGIQDGGADWHRVSIADITDVLK